MLGLVQTPSGPLVQRDLPAPDASGEAIIRLEVGGICATDLEIVRGYMGFSGVLGHEWVGVVEAAPDAASAWVGRRVVGDINCPCGACPTCRANRPTHCPNRTVLGIAGRDGAFRERLALPVANLHAVPDGVAPEAAVFVEPLAAALEITEQIHVRPTDRVAVLGVGRLGQLCARVLALTGAEVVGVGRSPARLALLPRSVRAVAAADLDERGFDVVVDCTGAAAGLARATELVRPRGTIVLKTTVHEAAGVAPTPWVIDEVTLVGSRCGPFEPALRALAAGLVDPTPLITARFPLGDGVAALAAAARPEHVKVLLEP
ncbi:MAG: alcohol dehydrogenase catalytic domain-containing protein [Deltaproteobacteria bacterium]|nr:alcohol dehydrogenase catalytic domain-containing protein [Deltaproteobacteria bacterium]